MKTQTPLQLKPGFCPFSGKEIWKNENGRMVRLEGYSDYWIALSDGSKMKIGIHNSVKMTNKKVTQFMDTQKQYWIEGILKELEIKKEQNTNYYNSLNPIGHAKKERDL